MRKFDKIEFLVIALALILCIGINGAAAADETPSITFAWDQDAETFAVLTRWQMAYGETAGGPFTNFIDIPKVDAQPDGSYQATADILYSGAPGEVVTQYFILRACISAEDTDCSAWSSPEVEHAVTIPIGPPGDFRKVSSTVSIIIKPIIKDNISAIEDDGQPAGG